MHRYLALQSVKLSFHKDAPITHVCKVSRPARQGAEDARAKRLAISLKKRRRQELTKRRLDPLNSSCVAYLGSEGYVQLQITARGLPGPALRLQVEEVAYYREDPSWMSLRDLLRLS